MIVFIEKKILYRMLFSDKMFQDVYYSYLLQILRTLGVTILEADTTEA